MVMDLIPLACIIFVAVSPTTAQLAAPSSVTTTIISPTSFSVGFSLVPGATAYRVTYTAQHNPTDTGSVTVTSSPAKIEPVRSNTNYKVTVQGSNATENGIETQTLARTAPDGSRILNVITTPTFLTIFTEETPGATAWEVEVNDTITGTSWIISVPTGVPSNTLYVAVIKDLLPYTTYSLRARVTELNKVTTFSLLQSPFGSSILKRTDSITVFGRVVLLTRPYNNTIIPSLTTNEIAAELLTAYKATSSNVLDVKIIKIDNDTTSNMLCHHEIVLNDRTASPDVSRLNLTNTTLYGSLQVTANGRYLWLGSTVGGNYLFLKQTNFPTALPTFLLSFQFTNDSLKLCTESEDTRTWTFYSKDSQGPTVLLLAPDALPESAVTLTLDGTSIHSFLLLIVRSDINPVTSALQENTLYGIKQDYLIRLCSNADPQGTTMYTRLYGAMSPDTTNDVDKYSIIYGTGLTNGAINASKISGVSGTTGTDATVIFPSTLVRRLKQATVTYQNSSGQTVSTTLDQANLDESSLYTIPLSGLSPNATTALTLTFTIQSEIESESTTVQAISSVTTDRDECVMDKPCSVHASCTNTIGGFFCTCLSGYIGNGTVCEDVNECLAPNNCSSNANCLNTDGSYTCACKSGFMGDGFVCNDIPECTVGHNCSASAICTNTIGNYTCTCNDLTFGDGRTCANIPLPTPSFTSVSTTEFLINWIVPVIPNSLSYTVTVENATSNRRKRRSTTASPFSINVTTQPVLFDKGQPGLSYTVTVSVVGKSVSAQGNVITLPAAPLNMVVRRNKTHAIVSWDPSIGSVVYEVNLTSLPSPFKDNTTGKMYSRVQTIWSVFHQQATLLHQFEVVIQIYVADLYLQ
ncbi:uncharacterized protein LOC144745492 [Ciona intestinalis]